MQSADYTYGLYGSVNLFRLWASSLDTTASMTARPHFWGVHPRTEKNHTQLISMFTEVGSNV